MSADEKVVFTAQQAQWYEQACAKIDPRRLKKLISSLTGIASPTGLEAEAAGFLAAYMTAAGLSAEYQSVSSSSGNCIGKLAGSGDGAKLMLYAPLDTHLEGRSELDLPWAGAELREDMRLTVTGDEDTVIGLGASNPKSMVATITEAALCVREAGIPLRGDLLVASCGGGMPWRVKERDNAGLSSGVTHMLSGDMNIDMGVIFKTWDDIYYEHPGMAWFKITVRGSLGYAGIPHNVPEFRSALVPAAKLMLALEEWLQAYPQNHMTAQVKPEGWIAAVRSGWPQKPAFPAAACEIYIDVRTNPDQQRGDIEKEFSGFMHELIRQQDDLQAEWELYEFCQGARTDAQHWIVKSATRGWEYSRQKDYPGAAMLSGQTDAATICRMGIPLVRVGFPFGLDKAMPEAFRDGLGGMGVAYISDLITPLQHLIYIIIDTCTRTREEVGL